MMAELEVKKWGNSVGIIIPKDIVKVEDIQVGDKIKIEIEKEKRINGFGMWKGAPPLERDRDDRVDKW